MIFLDTNYFLRFLLKDNKNQYLIVKRLFLQASFGKIELFTSLVVFFEICWVLRSYYGKDKKNLCIMLGKLLKMNFIDFPERYLLEKSLGLFGRENLSFEDCYNFVFAKEKKATSFATFDKKLKTKFKALTNFSPARDSGD
jgi:predicted nucleic-acid-binding protein